MRFLSNCLKVMWIGHLGQFRGTGEPYASHLLAVARIFRSVPPDDLMGLGANCLHDVVEDSQITAKQMSGILKPEVAMIVDALAKRPVEEFCSREDCEDEYYGHLLTLVAINPRIALVNLFD